MNFKRIRQCSTENLVENHYIWLRKWTDSGNEIRWNQQPISQVTIKSGISHIISSILNNMKHR